MASGHTLLQQALILDTETLGLQRGSGVHELAVYNLQTSALNEFILTPNMVQVAAHTAQERTRLATSTLDSHQLMEDPRWVDTIRRQLKMNDPTLGALKSTEEVRKALEVAQPWLAKSLNTYPHLLGRTESSSQRNARLTALKASGVNSFTSQVTTPAELFKTGGLLQQTLAQNPSQQGTTLWLANASFDSKQIGAITSGLTSQGIASSLKENLQTAGPTADPYYTTGTKLAEAKVLAQKTGDWTGVWRAMVEDTPKAGETAVRDIQDVLRSMMSYGQKLGLTSGGDVYWGTGLDTQYRLMGSLEGGAAGEAKLLSAESHRAAEDIAIHSKYVLERGVRYTQALQEVHDNTAQGRLLKQQALQHKSGDYYEAANLLARQELLKPVIQQDNAWKRLGRAQQDILEQGSTFQVDGWDQVKQLTQHSPSQGKVSLPILAPHREQMTDLGEVVNLLKAQGKYQGLDLDAQAQELQNYVGSIGTSEQRSARLTEFLSQKTDGNLEQAFKSRASEILSTVNPNLAKAGPGFAAQQASAAATALSTNLGKSLHGGLGAAVVGAAGLAGAGMAMAALNSGPKEPSGQRSIVSYNYHQWLENQAAWSGSRSLSEQQEGMSERGVAGANRKHLTDFGSPYQGMVASQDVFDQQAMQNERENWLRSQYGVRHYDPEIGLFGQQGAFSRARHQGYSYLAGADKVEANYSGLRGDNLQRINLGDGNWRVNVEDADTVSVQRAGFTAGVKSFFGLNQSYSFRLAGVDSPEIQHGDSRAQPHAEASADALRAMLSGGSNAELVFDPAQTTYGRTMGVLLQDGKNLNYELVKRGVAGFLPFGKSGDSMIDYGVMRGMEQGARSSTRGMWSQPYWQAMYDTTARGDRLTFNTLTKPEKIVENKATMDMVALMEQAQGQGMYTNVQAMEAASIGRMRHRGVDKVRPVVVTGRTANHYDGYLQDMLRESGNLSKTKGSNRVNAANALSARNGYRNFDKALVLDSMGHTNSVWSRRKLAVFDRYGAGNERAGERKVRMMAAQQHINQNVFNTTQNHTSFQLGG